MTLLLGTTLLVIGATLELTGSPGIALGAGGTWLLGIWVATEAPRA